MRCKFCGAVTAKRQDGSAKVFCGYSCRRLFRRDLNIKPGTFLEAGPDYPAVSEIEMRRSLIMKAREGDGKARRELRVRYKLTGLWNGKRVVAL